MSTCTSTELCLSNFLEQTAEATDWHLLGAFMKLPPKDLTLIEKQFSSGGPTRCKIELFNVWTKRTPNASWELIAAALEKSGETVLAENIRKGCVLPTHASQPSASAASTVSVVPLDKTLVVSFSTLETEFAVVVKNIEVLLKRKFRKKKPLMELGRFLDIRLDLDGELAKINDIDDLLQQIRPHFCLFNTVILKDIVEEFVGEPLKTQLEKYRCELEKFNKIAKISLLEKVKFLDQSSSADMPQVIFKLTGFWPSVTIKRFQRFVDHVFEANSSALTHIRVKQGCICVTWYARKSAIASLAARAQEKVLFMRHVGVLSLSVGDTVILEQEETEEEETDLSSALIQAITADCTEAVEFLLFLGADPNCTSANETTPLVLACRNNSVSIAKLLLRAEANVNAQDKRGLTALKLECSLKTPNKDLVELLVQFRAQLVVPGEEITALEIDTREGHTDIVQYLASEGAPVNAQDSNGMTSLMYACRYKGCEMVRILLSHRADPNIQNRNSSTALHFACYMQMTVGVELLLAHGADHSLPDKWGLTPLMYACTKKIGSQMDTTILVLLLSAGADPNAQAEEGSVPLIAAAKCDYKEGVSILLNAGANVNIPNILGSTALHEAARNGFLSISELLLASGAQASLINNDGMTPLDYALDNNHHDVCQLILANLDSNPLPAVTESTDTSETHSDLSLFMTETIEQESELLFKKGSRQNSAVSTLDQLRYALEYPLSPDDTIKHHQADEEEEQENLNQVIKICNNGFHTTIIIDFYTKLYLYHINCVQTQLKSTVSVSGSIDCRSW